MENIIKSYIWSEETKDNIIRDIVEEKGNLKVDVIVSCWAKHVIHELGMEKFDEISNLKYETIDYEFKIREDLLKLSFDLWRDFDYYRNFTFESKYDSLLYKKGLEDLHMVEVNNQWKATELIDEEVVIQNVLNYIICYSIWKQQKKMISTMCSFCDASLQYSSFCPDCETPVDEMINPQENAEDLNVDDFWICKHCSTNNDFQLQYCKVCSEAGPHCGKHLCHKCHFINHRYDCVCSTCYEPNMYLKNCIQCQTFLINSKYEIICYSCKAKLTGDWICEDPENHPIYGPKEMKCKGCNNIPVEPPKKNEHFFNFDADNKKIELWKCTFCHENSKTEKTSCDNCLNLRYCDNNILCYYCGTVNFFNRTGCLKCKKEFVTKMQPVKHCIIS